MMKIVAKAKVKKFRAMENRYVFFSCSSFDTFIHDIKTVYSIFKKESKKMRKSRVKTNK